MNEFPAGYTAVTKNKLSAVMASLLEAILKVNRKTN